MNTFADEVVGAVETVSILWPYNEQAIEDTGIEMAVLAALGQWAPKEANGKAVHRLANPDHPANRARSLLVGLNVNHWSDWDLDHGKCDRCVRDVPPRWTLLVPAGATVVELHVCGSCREQLDADLPGLEW